MVCDEEYACSEAWCKFRQPEPTPMGNETRVVPSTPGLQSGRHSKCLNTSKWGVYSSVSCVMKIREACCILCLPRLRDENHTICLLKVHASVTLNTQAEVEGTTRVSLPMGVGSG